MTEHYEARKLDANELNVDELETVSAGLTIDGLREAIHTVGAAANYVVEFVTGQLPSPK